ncbi:MAG: hypothetical protein Q7R89_00915 [bacterium]|nr:hypothetical protein [bacterium]
MTQIVTPSAKTTAGQIDKAVANYRALLEKHAGEFSSEPVQQVLGDLDFVGEMVGVFRRRVEAVSNMVTRHAHVDRARTPQEVLDATGRKQYTDRNVVNTMPRGQGEEVDIYFFKFGRYISDLDLEKEYESRGLKPADPYSLTQVNTVDPAFADTHPNGTHWQNAKGNWCFATFGHWRGGRGVGVGGHDGWSGNWWFAGFRK